MSYIEDGARLDQAIEQERIESIGVVLVVLAGETLDSGDPMIRTVKELQGKTQTERKPGQISFPAETRKEEEKEMGNLLGAVAELTDSDEAVSRLRLDPTSFYARGAIQVGGKPADVVFMVYDGPLTDPLQPIDQAETQANGWMGVTEITHMNGQARPLVHDVLRFARAHGVIEQIAGNKDGMVPFGELLDEGFSLQEFIQARNTSDDIQLN
jgi:hypothetical protein